MLLDLISDRIARGDAELGRGRHAAAQDLYRLAMDLLPPDEADHPAELRALRANLAERLGDCAFRSGRIDEARRQFESGSAIWDILVEEAPWNHDWLRNRGLLLGRLGTLASSQMNHADAVVWLRRSVELAEKLNEFDAGNYQWRNDLSNAWGSLADAQVQAGQVAEALVSYRASIVVLEKLARASIDNKSSARNIAIGLFGVARCLRILGSHDEAFREFEACRQVRLELAEESPKNELLWTDLMMVHRAIAELEEVRGRYARSIQYRKEAFLVALKACQQGAFPTIHNMSLMMQELIDSEQRLG